MIGPIHRPPPSPFPVHTLPASPMQSRHLVPAFQACGTTSVAGDWVTDGVWKPKGLECENRETQKAKGEGDPVPSGHYSTNGDIRSRGVGYSCQKQELIHKKYGICSVGFVETHRPWRIFPLPQLVDGPAMVKHFSVRCSYQSLWTKMLCFFESA